MKKIFNCFIILLISLFFINNKICAIDVDSSGNYTVFGSQHNLDTGIYRSGSGWIYNGRDLVNEIQKYNYCPKCKNQNVKEICYYYNGDVDDGTLTFNTDNTKILFIFDNDAAGVAWYANRDTLWRYTGKLLNWKANDSSEWSSGHAKNSDDASTKYKKSGLCPDYLVQAQDFDKNYFYLSTSANTSNLTHIQNLAKKEPGDKIITYYSIGDYVETKKQTLVCDYGVLKIGANEDGNLFGYNLPFGSKVENTGQSSSQNDLTVAMTYLSPKFRSSRYKAMFKNGKCPKQITACAKNPIAYWWSDVPWVASGGMNLRDIVIYGDESFADDGCDASDQVYFQCNGDNCSDEDSCLEYDDYELLIDSDVSSYSSCGDDKNCQKVALKNYNTHKDELKMFCLSYLENLNYTEGGCVQSCLNYYDYLAEKEVSLGIRSKVDNYKCGIGSSIISMVYNVLKWAKYILPALVIILTMLDFIKAIAAQNDDDMKKAQGKFVKRLIVAALLFLLPLIINLVLQTFGFYDQNCDITDLFKK